MENESEQHETSAVGWQATHAYGMALVCLLLGLAIGYFLRGSQSPAAKPEPAQAALAPPAGGMGAAASQEPTVEQMKHAGDKTVAPLLEKLKTDPNNAELLNEVGKIYRATHQFTAAAAYYEKALQVDPKNVAVRTDLASCLYYNGDVDGALAQLEKSLTYDPKFNGALLNIGIIKWKGKNDVAGAVASWERLLKANQDPKQRELVQHLIAEAKKGAAKAPPKDPKG